MTQVHSNTKEHTFTHLTEIERGQIAAYIDEGLSLREIAGKVGRNVSTISREKKRDVGARVYEESRKNCGAHSTIMTAWEFIRFAEEKILKEKWSPDAAVGYAKRQEKFEYIPPTKTLYNWIDEGKLSVINMDLEMKLRRSTKTTKSCKHKKVLGTSIEEQERPESIETREAFGHREIDKVLGPKSKGDALLTLVERNTRHEIIRRIPTKSSPAVTDALQAIFAGYSEVHHVFKSITADNGSEFSELSNQGKELQIEVCFAHPYASWERGSNERQNGIIRKFIKKGQPIHTYTDEHIAEVENWMNTLPRENIRLSKASRSFRKIC